MADQALDGFHECFNLFVANALVINHGKTKNFLITSVSIFPILVRWGYWKPWLVTL